MIFVDTSFWVAYSIRSDQRHEQALAIFDAHVGAGLATSNLICGETWTFVRYRHGHRAAVAVTDLLDGTPRLRTVRIGDDEEREAWSWLRSHGDRAYSFVDATSFAVMRRLAIREAFAFDADFASAGFVELRS